LGGQGQHFQNSGLPANQGYANYPQANQGYNNNNSNYGMGGGQGRQQYPNQFYGRE